MTITKRVLLHIAAPAIAGAVIASMIGWAPTKPSAADKQAPAEEASRHRSRTADNTLPIDPRLIRIAAMAGRTAPAREQLMAALAAEASDDELAPWLAAILVSDPAWLDSLLSRVPKPRRAGLVDSTLHQLIRLDARALWPVLRASPYAAELAKAQLGHDSQFDPFGPQSWIMQSAFIDPTAALDYILDPANGIPDTAARQVSAYDVPSASRVLNEWQDGRWQDAHYPLVSFAWHTLAREAPEALAEIRANLSDAQQEDANRMHWWSEFHSNPTLEIPTPTDLAHLNADQIEAVQQRLSAAGIPIPLATLAGLTPDQRREALRIQSYNLREFTPEQVRSHIESLPSLPLLDAEKATILSGASEYLWKEAGDYQGALDLAARIPDPDRFAEATGAILRGLSREDPATAIRFAPNIEDESLRDEFIKAAQQNLP